MKVFFFKFLFFASMLIQAIPAWSADQRYTYYENDGIFIYYQTQEREIYRKLLPSIFEMPDELLVYTFISDFYKMDANTTPYKEAAIFLLAKHQGRNIWHCVFMPVTSQESRVLGIRRLGLPKTMGQINFEKASPLYKAKAVTEDGYEMLLKVNTQAYEFSGSEKEAIEELSTLPKLNLLNNEVIQMGRSSKRSIIQLSKIFKDKLLLKAGVGELSFKQPKGKNAVEVHPLNLTLSNIVASYYLKNSIPFRLNGRPVK